MKPEGYRSPLAEHTERLVLGAILAGGRWEKARSAGLSVDDFSLSAHRCICSRIAELRENEQPIDVETVATSWNATVELERVGGYGYICGLTDGVPLNTDIAFHVRALHENAVRRRADNQAETLHSVTPRRPISGMPTFGN